MSDRRFNGWEGELIRTLILLKLPVSGHLIIYLSRDTGVLWDRPLPGWKLFATTEATLVLGTLAAVYGVFTTPTLWPCSCLRAGSRC